MIVRLLVIYVSAFVIGGVGLYVASRRQPPQVRRERLIKFVTYFCIVNVVLFSALAGHWILSGLMLLIAALGARELYRALLNTAGGSLLLICAIATIYLFVAAAAIFFAWQSNSHTAVFVYLVVCAFDGFSQVAGQLFGKHQLAASISPGKTIEGSLGGLLFAVGMALVLRPLIGTSILQSVVASGYIVAAALSGDLLASLVKRKSQIKDFGDLLPGHGGILDRFDSFLLAAAACAALGLVGQWLFGSLR